MADVILESPTNGVDLLVEHAPKNLHYHVLRIHVVEVFCQQCELHKYCSIGSAETGLNA